MFGVGGTGGGKQEAWKNYATAQGFRFVNAPEWRVHGNSHSKVPWVVRRVNRDIVQKHDGSEENGG